MTYNADNAKEYVSTTPKTELPADTIIEAAIISIEDGQIKDFVLNLEKWKQPEQPSIKVNFEGDYLGKKIVGSQMMVYFDIEGVTTFGKKSDLAKFQKKYGSLPKVGGKVKIMTSLKGYPEIKLE